MAVSIPTIEPETLIAGDTSKWTRALSDYLPEDSWVLTYAFVKDGLQEEITATDNGDGTHLCTIAATDSETWDFGVYHWQAYVTLSGERYTVGKGQITVRQNLAADASDPRTHVKKTLDALEAVIESRATADQLSYSVAGRSLSKMTPEQLIMMHDRYKRLYADEVKAERLAQGLGHKGKVLVRFA